MSYHRFIGGPHDGEWRDVPRNAGLFLPPIVTIAKRPEIEFNIAAQLVELTMSNRRTDYVPLSLHVDGKKDVVTFFIERGMKPEDAFLQLAAGYRSTAVKGSQHD